MNVIMPRGCPVICEDNFVVSTGKGGRQGDRGVYPKVFKSFAFVQFDLIRDAAKFLEVSDGQTYGGRTVRSHPTVLEGTWLWLKGHWWSRVPAGSKPINGTDQDILIIQKRWWLRQT